MWLSVHLSLSLWCLRPFLIRELTCQQGPAAARSSWRFYLKSREAALAVPKWSTGALCPAFYTSVSPALTTQTPPEELFRGYFKGKFVPSLPGGNPDTSVRPEHGHRVASFPHTAKVPGLFFFPLKFLWK